MREYAHDSPFICPILLAPAFAAMTVLITISFVNIAGLLRLSLSTSEVSIGISFIDVILQGAIIFLIACFLVDFWYYWWHRAQHKIPFLWELHKLHHSDENLNSTTIYRSHFLEPAGQSLVRGLTIGLIFDTTEAPQTALAIVAGGLLPLLWDYFIHANVRIDALHRLMPFFSAPQYHWIHHSKMLEHRDKNFSIWLPMFDIAFGSYYHPKVDEYPATRLSSGEKIESVWEAQTGPSSIDCVTVCDFNTADVGVEPECYRQARMPLVTPPTNAIDLSKHYSIGS